MDCIHEPKRKEKQQLRSTFLKRKRMCKKARMQKNKKTKNLNMQSVRVKRMDLVVYITILLFFKTWHLWQFFSCSLNTLTFVFLHYLCGFVVFFQYDTTDLWPLCTFALNGLNSCIQKSKLSHLILHSTNKVVWNLKCCSKCCMSETCACGAIVYQKWNFTKFLKSFFSVLNKVAWCWCR